MQIVPYLLVRKYYTRPFMYIGIIELLKLEQIKDFYHERIPRKGKNKNGLYQFKRGKGAIKCNIAENGRIISPEL